MIDLLIKNAHVINFETQSFEKRSIGVNNGLFCEPDSEYREVIEGTGKYIVPGFIDSHVHYESSFVEIENFASILAKNGVTTAIIDCHEIANVYGCAAIDKVLGEIEVLNSDFFIQLPSCVPSCEEDQSPSTITAKDLEKYNNNQHVSGLGEVMNIPGVLNQDSDLLQKIKALQLAGKTIDGHAPSLERESLELYCKAGIMTNHECETFVMGKMCLEQGMYVHIREGSVAQNLDALLPLFQYNSQKLTFCTDDKTISDILKSGSINFHVKKAIEFGVNPIEAFQAASLNAARCYNLQNRGAITNGYIADFLLLDSLEQVNIEKVFKDGIRIDNLTQRIPTQILEKRALFQQSFKHFKMPDVSLQVSGRTNVIEVVPNKLISNQNVVTLLDSQNFEGDNQQQLMKITLIPRMVKSDKVGIGIVKNCYFDGALAITTAHDAHHLITLSNNDCDLLLAIEEVRRLNGGIVYCRNGQIMEAIPLEIAGLVTEMDPHIFDRKYQNLVGLLQQNGFSGSFDPIIALSFLGLPVIPNIKLTLNGYFDANTWSYLPLKGE